MVILGGTGFADDLHVAHGGPVSGALVADDNLPQEAVHNGRRVLGNGPVLGGGVVVDDVAVGVLNAGIGGGLVIIAAVAEGGVSRRQLIQVDAVGNGAKGQGGTVVAAVL